MVVRQVWIDLDNVGIIDIIVFGFESEGYIWDALVKLNILFNNLHRRKEVACIIIELQMNPWHLVLQVFWNPVTKLKCGVTASMNKLLEGEWAARMSTPSRSEEFVHMRAGCAGRHGAVSIYGL